MDHLDIALKLGVIDLALCGSLDLFQPSAVEHIFGAMSQHFVIRYSGVTALAFAATLYYISRPGTLSKEHIKVRATPPTAAKKITDTKRKKKKRRKETAKKKKTAV